MRAFFDRLRLVRWLRRLRFDLVIVPNGGMHRSSIQFARQPGAQDCRWHDADSEFDDRKPEHVATRPIGHEALSGFRPVPELGRTGLDGLALSVPPNRALQDTWYRLLGPRTKPRVGLRVSNKAAERRWPADRWRELGRRHVTPPSVAELVAAASPLDTILRAGATVGAIDVDALERAVLHLLKPAAQPDDTPGGAIPLPAETNAAPGICAFAS